LTELIRFGSRQMLEKFTDSDLTLDTGTTVIQPVQSVHDLGVYLDSALTTKTHITKVVSSCFYHLRRIRHVRRLVGRCRPTAGVSLHTVTARLLQLTFVTSAMVNYPASAANIKNTYVDGLK